MPVTGFPRQERRMPKISWTRLYWKSWTARDISMDSTGKRRDLIIGVMEYWSTGVLRASLQHSITPLLHFLDRRPYETKHESNTDHSRRQSGAPEGSSRNDGCEIMWQAL